jgi:hypothetical protein
MVMIITYRLSLSENEEPYRASFEAMLEFLSTCYIRTQWHQITKRGYDRPKIFAHCILQAASKQNIKQFIDKLCYRLGLEQCPVSSQCVELMESNEQNLLRMIRKENLYLILRCREIAKQFFEDKKQEKKKNVSI